MNLIFNINKQPKRLFQVYAWVTMAMMLRSISVSYISLLHSLTLPKPCFFLTWEMD